MDILIIDDQAIVRRTLHRYIENRGDTPYMAENGHAGLAIIQKHLARPQIVDPVLA